jgi:hypothetical protein
MVAFLSLVVEEIRLNDTGQEKNTASSYPEEHEEASKGLSLRKKGQVDGTAFWIRFAWRPWLPPPFPLLLRYPTYFLAPYLAQEQLLAPHFDSLFVSF